MGGTKLHMILFYVVRFACQLDTPAVYPTHQRHHSTKTWDHKSVFVLPQNQIRRQRKTATSSRVTARDVLCHVSQESVPAMLEREQSKTVRKEAGLVRMECRQQGIAHEKND